MGPGFESPEVHQISLQCIYYIVEVEVKSKQKQRRDLFPVTNRLVFLTHRVHLYPFRTQKLSCAKPKILARRRAGKIGQCQHFSFILEVKNKARITKTTNRKVA